MIFTLSQIRVFCCLFKGHTLFYICRSANPSCLACVPAASVANTSGPEVHKFLLSTIRLPQIPLYFLFSYMCNGQPFTTNLYDPIKRMGERQRQGKVEDTSSAPNL